jgi:sterol desaturase/sphingolipid hydroxylase (fatty acid hydroxylase superfamily)
VHHAIAFASQVLSLTVWLVLLTIVFIPLERLFALQLTVRRRRDIAGDLTFYFLNSLAPTFLLALPLSVLATIALQFTPSAYSEFIGGLSIWVRVPAGVVVGEFGAYWAHRLCHETPWMWRFHKVHHSPESLDWMVNTRAHPLDVAFTRLGGLTPLYLLGLATPSGEGQLLPIIVTLFGTVWAFFVHANLKWRYGPLEWLIATPAFHHWHHTNDEHRDHNYAALLPVIDRLFGTHYLPAQWPPVYGVDEPVAPGVVSQILDPLSGPVRAPAASPPREARPGS